MAEKHSHSFKYLHCSKCVHEQNEAGLMVFVTEKGDLGIACRKHEDFREIIDNKSVSAALLDIALEPCQQPDCPINKKEVYH